MRFKKSQGCDWPTHTCRISSEEERDSPTVDAGGSNPSCGTREEEEVTRLWRIRAKANAHLHVKATRFFFSYIPSCPLVVATQTLNLVSLLVRFQHWEQVRTPWREKRLRVATQSLVPLIKE
jgi:hypothetical protein